MDQLFTPHAGLMIWTVLTFLVLVGILARFAWRPILKAMDDREEALRAHARAAEDSRTAAERFRREYEEKLAGVETRTRELLAEAEARGRRLVEELKQSAESENARLIENTRAKLVEEEKRILRSLQKELAEISVRAAERVLQQGVDASTEKRLLQVALGEVEKWTVR